MKPREGVKPARFEMLGDPQTAEMLSKGPGETVSLEKEAQPAAAEAKSPMFTQLWYDPGSLSALTHSLAHTTAHMSKLAPHRAGGGAAESESLFQRGLDAGHSSYAERKFNSQMSKYRTALEQQRADDLAHAARTQQELRQLPAGSRGRDGLRDTMYKAQTTMLTEPQNGWEADRDGAYSRTQRAAIRHIPRVELAPRREERRGEERERRGESPRLRRVERELADSERRDDRLADDVDRLQGEVDELRDRRRGRFEDLAEVHRHSLRRQEEGRRSAVRDNAERRVRERFHEGRREERGRREEGDRHKAVAKKKFSPDATYEKEYAWDPGHVSVGEIKFQHALKDFDRTKSILREGAMQDDQHLHLPELVPQHLPGQGL